MSRLNTQQVFAAVREEMNALPGHNGFYYKNLVTGEEYGVREDEAFLAASVIKLPIYLHILNRAAAGTIDMSEPLTATAADKVPVCGSLTLYTGDATADIATLCRLMISLSDNTATNLLIKRCGIDDLNAGFAAMGLRQTVLRRFLFDAEASARGLENTVSPREMGMLLERLTRGEVVSEAVSKEAIEVLLQQQFTHKLNGKLCGLYPVANKTGNDVGISNDVGIVYADQPFVVCFTGHEADVYRWDDLIRRATYDLAMAVKEA